MKITEFNVYVIYGWSESLYQWHMAAIIPENFTESQTSHLKTMAEAAVNLATGQSKTIYRPKGTEFSIFIDEKTY